MFFFVWNFNLNIKYNINLSPEGARYDGYAEFDPTIRHFWTVFNELDDSQRKRLLEFFTGSDRCPVGGLGKLKMTITKNGPESNRLPTAHTCFNVLLLPEYQSVDLLRDRLLKALDNAMGFGLVWYFSYNSSEIYASNSADTTAIAPQSWFLILIFSLISVQKDFLLLLRLNKLNLHGLGFEDIF